MMKVKSNEPTKTKCKMAMKNFLTMAALALVGAIIAGCSGSDDIIDNPQPATQKDNIVTMKTTVGLESGGETRAGSAYAREDLRRGRPNGSAFHEHGRL